VAEGVITSGLSVLTVRELEVRRAGVAVVKGVTFSVARGEIVALTGASGSGKTSVLRAIAGLDRVHSGTISIEGGRMGMVLQFHHLFEHLTVTENICLAPVHVHRRSTAEAGATAKALLERLGVAHRADAMPHELSGGEAQRVAIARALAVDPPVLLMDEPTASLDASRREEIAATLRGLAADGRTIVIATHDAAFLAACAQRVLVLENGVLIPDP
jgi:polar amino acid transport system ATP-binding protein